MEIIPTGQVREPKFATELDNQSQFSADFNSFLTLLTTQLQNQDPLEPMETSEFTQQLVQYSSVEQSIIGNGYLEDLVAANTTNQQLEALEYLGRTVEMEGSNLSLKNGSADFQYLVDGNYDKVSIAIIDENDSVVRTIEGEKTEGIQNFTWDGRDSQGAPLPDGSYRVTVAGTVNGTDGEEATAIGLSTIINGIVESISNDDNGNPQLTVNGLKRNISDVLAIKETN